MRYLCFADVDECAVGTDDCDANAVCANVYGVGLFMCTCDAANAYFGDGKQCSRTRPLCCPLFSFHEPASCTPDGHRTRTGHSPHFDAMRELLDMRMGVHPWVSTGRGGP